MLLLAAFFVNQNYGLLSEQAFFAVWDKNR